MKALEEIEAIHGVGSIGAMKLYDDGYTSIEKIREDPSGLSRIQKIGLQYYDDLKKKIPAQEAA